MMGGHPSDPPPFRPWPKNARRPSPAPLSPFLEPIDEHDDDETVQVQRRGSVRGSDAHGAEGIDDDDLEPTQTG